MMRVAALSTLLLSGLVAAQDVQSKAFNLVIKSANTTLNGQNFAACHTGAAIESLCLAGDEGSEFYLNTTDGAQAPIDGYSPSGILVWNLPLGGDEPTSESEAMQFYVDPSTNVALPLFEPSYTAQYVSFDEEELLTITSSLDDTTQPPESVTTKALQNWYVCQTNYLGYQYFTLSWVLGSEGAKPQNPSCTKVDVERKYV